MLRIVVDGKSKQHNKPMGELSECQSSLSIRYIEQDCCILCSGKMLLDMVCVIVIADVRKRAAEVFLVLSHLL